MPMLHCRRTGGESSQVRLEHARPNEKLYTNRCWAYRQPATRTRYVDGPLREAGTTAEPCSSRRRQALERRSSVLPRESTEILHALTGRSRDGELPPMPRACRPCKRGAERPEDFKIIGASARRRYPGEGQQDHRLHIDVRLPGMKIATLAQSPASGGRVKNVDDAASKAVKDVRQIVRLDDTVAVIPIIWRPRRKSWLP